MEFQQKAKAILKTKTDVTDWLVRFIENYPNGKNTFAKGNLPLQDFKRGCTIT
jgi:hypothetical protein